MAARKMTTAKGERVYWQTAKVAERAARLDIDQSLKILRTVIRTDISDSISPRY